MVVNAVALLVVVIVAWSVTRWVADRSVAWDDEDAWSVESQTDVSVDVDACVECEGVGALVGSGRVRPCPRCHGTGT